MYIYLISPKRLYMVLFDSLLIMYIIIWWKMSCTIQQLHVHCLYELPYNSFNTFAKHIWYKLQHHHVHLCHVHFQRNYIHVVCFHYNDIDKVHKMVEMIWIVQHTHLTKHNVYRYLCLFLWYIQNKSWNNVLHNDYHVLYHHLCRSDILFWWLVLQLCFKYHPNINVHDDSTLVP